MSQWDAADAEGRVQMLKALAGAFDTVGDRLRSGRATPVLEAVPPAALELVDGARWASVTMLHRGKFRTIGETDERARRADLLQYELGAGPCVDAVLEDTMYCPADLVHDDRWPVYGRRVADELGIRSVLAFRLGLVEGEQSIAGLNLYADRPGAFDEGSQWTGLLLATHAAALVMAAGNAERAGHLATALKSNREIGAAVGIVMASGRLTQEEAFTVLRVASQDTNRKLSELASEVVATGELPLSARLARPT